MTDQTSELAQRLDIAAHEDRLNALEARCELLEKAVEELTTQLHTFKHPNKWGA